MSDVSSWVPFSNLTANVRAATSRKDKQQALVDGIAKNPPFKDMVVLAMDPSINFNVGVRSIKPKSFGASHLTGPDLDILKKIAARELNRTNAAAWATERCKQLTPAEAELLIQIFDKDLSWGLGASSVNAAIPNLLSEFNCMLAQPYDTKAISYPCYIEPKFDGMRVLAIAKGSSVDFFTRSGKLVTSLPESLVQEILILSASFGRGEIVFDGEVMGDSFKETMERARRKSEVFDKAKYYIFDWLTLEEFRTIGKTESGFGYRDRRLILAKHMAGFFSGKHLVLPQSYLVGSEEEVSHYYGTFRDRGLEGAIIKAKEGKYIGKRSAYWIKMKAEETEDLEIIGYEEGEGKFVGTLGAILVNRDGVTVRVGTGLSDEDRHSIWANRPLYLHKMVEVQFQEVTPDGSLRHPRFIRLRMDKSEW
jgi:DNA ligase-1